MRAYRILNTNYYKENHKFKAFYETFKPKLWTLSRSPSILDKHTSKAV